MATANTRRNADADADDLYITPPEHTQAFIETMRGLCEPVFNPGHMVWEPCAGRGDIAKKLEADGAQVWATDLNNWGYGLSGVNILTTDFSQCHNLITNPPFGILNNILAHVLPQLPNGAKMSMLLRLAAIETKDRVKLLQLHGGLKYVLPFAYRIGCPRIDKATGAMLPVTNSVAYAWLHWQIGYTGRPQIEWITND